MITPDCSVVVCTRNPHEGRLRRTLDALKGQTMDRARWELLLIDNASDPGLCGAVDLSWHRNVQVIREEVVGLTPARLRGIRESAGQIIVFVDDDNVLQPDYLEQAWEIACANQKVGVYGGSVSAEFEKPCPGWLVPLQRGLAISEIDRDHCSSDRFSPEGLPFGAGLCVRSTVARTYALQVATDVVRRRLDRRGQELASGGDMDLVWTALDLGFWAGRFSSLRLLHLIPASRMTEDYVVRLYAGFAAADLVLRYSRGFHVPDPQFPSLAWIRSMLLLMRCSTRVERRIFLASRRSRAAARRTIVTSGPGSAQGV